MTHGKAGRDSLYRTIARSYGEALARLAAAHEADPALREDLEQEIHLQLWRSLALYGGQASLATWTFRVAGNVCADHVAAQLRARKLSGLVRIEDLELADTRDGPETVTNAALALEKIYATLRRLEPLDRQVMLLYLEALPAGDIAEITGLSAGAVATRVHRVKAVLADRFAQGVTP